MNARKLLIVVLSFAIALSACTPAATPAPAPASQPTTVPPPAATSLPVISATASQVKPITLRLAVADEEGVPSDPYVREFVEQVKTRSSGQLVIEPVWSAGDDTDEGFERGVIQHLTKGDMELGLAASRAWDVKKYPNLQPLQAPFLITNDALALAVAQSDSAKQMLDSLSAGGMVGLALWPEDLRHPFSIDPTRPLLSPGDFKGLNIRTTTSGVSYQLVSALGGKPMFEDSGYEGAESGLRQGFSLNGKPAATGNVTFFPKFQVLFANATAFDKLSEDQRAILREAAAATQKKALAEHPSEVEAAKAWCADGGTVVLASTEQVAAFEQAAQPVFDAIAQDAVNAKLIAAIRDLKSKTTASPGAEACAPQAAQAPTSVPKPASTPAAPIVVKGRIAFNSDRTGNNDIYVMNGDGSGLTNLTNNPADDTGPVWSPDGKKILFTTNRDGNYEIYVMNADGSHPTNLTKSPANEGDGSSPESIAMDWSPDGKKIAFMTDRDGNQEIYVMNSDGSDPTNLTNNPADDIYPEWSADGKQIGFTTIRDSNYELYVMNADGSNPTRLTNTPADDALPRWSPDGKQIVYVFGSGYGRYEIYVMNADGSNPTQLTNSPGPKDDNMGPRWSPDGKQIIFWSSRDGNRELYVMNADGSNQTRLTDNPANDANPMLQP